jgi:hypothetical protein
MRTRAVLIVCLLGLVLAGCGSQTTNPLCGGTCPIVTGQIERCGGPAPGGCTAQRVTAVSLFDAHGGLAVKENAGKSMPISRFRILAEVPGRYVLETTIAGDRVRRAVRLRSGETVHANLVAQVK